MADLFRVLMSENRDLVPLAQEIGLCHQYLDLEKLRLEDRLKITWQIDDMPSDAMIPPLILQPLLENAVYHGIQPLAAGGTVRLSALVDAGVLKITVENPFDARLSKAGNGMALANISARLRLAFGTRANLQTHAVEGRYVAILTLPLDA